MEYGEILKKLRTEKHKSQEEIALYAGVGKSQISKEVLAIIKRNR